MPRFTFNSKTGQAELAEGTVITGVSIKNIIDVKSYNIDERNGFVYHSIQFRNGSSVEVEHSNSKVNFHASNCSTTLSDDPEHPKGILVGVSPNK